MEKVRNIAECNEVLLEKFSELSEYFTQNLKSGSMEPEQKCEIIKTMLLIRRELTT